MWQDTTSPYEDCSVVLRMDSERGARVGADGPLGGPASSAVKWQVQEAQVAGEQQWRHREMDGPYTYFLR